MVEKHRRGHEGPAYSLADAALESHRIMVRRAFAARESGMRITRDFFERGLDALEEEAAASALTACNLTRNAGRNVEALGQLSGAALEVQSELLDPRRPERGSSPEA